MELENTVYQFCSEYAKRPSIGRRLVIHGNYGTGKSHTLRSVHAWATRLAINLPCVPGDDGFRLSSSLLLCWPETVHKLQKQEYWITDAAIEADLLLIDDIGAEHDPSKFGCEQLYLILERRERKWTIITTNATPETWEDKFERRVASRLIRNTDIVSTEDVPDWNSL